MMRRMAAGLCLLVVASEVATAERKVSIDQPIAVRLDVGQPTAIVLPEEILGFGVVVDPERLSLDYRGPYIFLTAMVPDVQGRFFPVGASGKLYKITYRVHPPGDDTVYVVQTPDAEQKGAPAKPVAVTVGMMLRAMRTGQALPGQAPVTDVPIPALNDERLAVSSWSAVQAGGLVGMAVSVRNKTEHVLNIDMRYGVPAEPLQHMVRVADWAMPPWYTVRGVHVGGEALEPQKEVTIYLILERRV